MARGWESKSVEDQVTAKETNGDESSARKQVAVAAATRGRQRQELELQRERILDARTSNPHRRAALEAALAEIEAKLAGL